MRTPRVLVVDDDASLRSALIRDLRRMGYEPFGAGTIDEALTAFEQGVDVALVDLELDGDSGYSLVRESERRGWSVPFVIISGTGDLDDVIQSFRGGAVDYLRKPFHRTEVAAAVEKALEARSTPAAEARPASAGDDQQIHRSRFRPAPSAAAPAPQPPAAPTEARQTALERFRSALDKGQIALPDLGSISTNIHDLLSRPTCGIDEVVKLIESDPAAAAEVLRVTNTARFRPPRAVTNLRAACMRLGNARVLGIAQEVLVRNALAVGDGPLQELGERMWRNTVVVAQGARELAARQPGVDADRVYLAGLLHNVGELVLLRLYSDLQSGSVAPLDLAAMGHQIHGLHESVGGKVLRSWKMSPALCRLAGEHHRSGPAPWDRESRRIRDLVMVSWHAAAELGHAWQIVTPDGPSPELIDAAGLDAEAVREAFADASSWAAGD